VDFLSWTAALEWADPEGWRAILEYCCGAPLELAPRRAGFSGYQHSAKLQGPDGVQLGLVAWGGDHQRGTLYVSLSGEGCAFVRHWDHVRAMLAASKARVTRVDLCADFFEGEYTIERATADVQAGAFNTGGRKPSTTVAGDWLEARSGRTVYVGRRENGKQVCIYEKGLQLASPLVKWVRVELRLGAKDRVIPLDVLLRPQEFLVGHVPVLRSLIAAAADVVRVSRAKARATVDRLIAYGRQSYGQLINLLVSEAGWKPSVVCRLLARPGVPASVRGARYREAAGFLALGAT
jgi:phage replication initiation protein